MHQFPVARFVTGADCLARAKVSARSPDFKCRSTSGTRCLPITEGDDWRVSVVQCTRTENNFFFCKGTLWPGGGHFGPGRTLWPGGGHFGPGADTLDRGRTLWPGGGHFGPVQTVRLTLWSGPKCQPDTLERGIFWPVTPGALYSLRRGNSLFTAGTWQVEEQLSTRRHRGNTYLTSLPSISDRRHGRGTQWRSRNKIFTRSASSLCTTYVATSAFNERIWKYQG